MCSFHTVVIWCDVLGSILPGEKPLPWSEPLSSHQISEERRETGETFQCSMLPGNVNIHVLRFLSIAATYTVLVLN